MTLKLAFQYFALEGVKWMEDFIGQESNFKKYIWTLKKGAPENLLWVQLDSYLEWGPLMWMMPLHVLNQKSDYNYHYDDMMWGKQVFLSNCGGFICCSS